MASNYDTLESIELPNDVTVLDLYTFVLGLPMAQADVCGTMTTGPLTLRHTREGTWGRTVRFNEHPELWAVRSAPAGRMGKPIERGEVRKVAVLVRDNERSPRGTVSLIKLWRMPSDEADVLPSEDGRHRDRGTRTYGAVGVAVHGISLFHEAASRGDPAAPNAHEVFSAVATIHKPDGNICRLESSMTPLYVLSGSIAGFAIPQVPEVRFCEEQFTETSWEKNELTLERLVASMHCSQDKQAAARLLCTAESVLEQFSFVGYLDAAADPFCDSALPDYAHQPSGIALMMAIAVRIACNPSRWGLVPARSEDAYATKEASFLIEAVVPSLVATASDGVSGVQSYSIDVVINRALEEMRGEIHKLQSGKADGSRHNIDHKNLSQVVKETMHFLYCTGVALCVDLFAVTPQQPDGSSGLYTSVGFAQPLADPVLESRTQSAYEANLGQLVTRWRTVRTSSRGRRQLALSRVLVSVDQWLKTHRYKGAVLSQTAQAPNSVLPQELDPSAASASAERIDTVSAAPRSCKKKKKKVEAMLAERGKLRDAKAQNFATTAVSGLFGNKNDPRLLESAAKLSPEAINQAAGVFADVLQCGGCMGISKLFKPNSYLVTPRSAMRCTNCEQFVNVVQSIAFSGKIGQCPTCKRPRCLYCVSAVIHAAAACPDAGYNISCTTCSVSN